jgi:hypothetical protein
METAMSAKLICLPCHQAKKAIEDLKEALIAAAELFDAQEAALEKAAIEAAMTEQLLETLGQHCLFLEEQNKELKAQLALDDDAQSAFIARLPPYTEGDGP